MVWLKVRRIEMYHHQGKVLKLRYFTLMIDKVLE